MEKIKSLTQKQIKAIKRDCLLNGAMSRGYFWSILDTQPATKIIGIMIDLVEQGYDIRWQSEAEIQRLFVDELIRQSSYQEFKNDLLPYIMG